MSAQAISDALTIHHSEEIPLVQEAVFFRVLKRDFERLNRIVKFSLDSIDAITAKAVPFMAVGAHIWLVYKYPVPALCGVAGIALDLISSLVLKKLNMVTSDPNNKYEKFITESPFYHVSLIGPLLEELIFRGALQNVLSSFGRNLSLITSAIMFGCMHLTNKHKNNYLQGIFSGINGVLLGLLNNQFGILGSLTSHSTRNLLCVATFHISKQLFIDENRS